MFTHMLHHRWVSFLGVQWVCVNLKTWWKAARPQINNQCVSQWDHFNRNRHLLDIYEGLDGKMEGSNLQNGWDMSQMQVLKSFWTDKECFKSICRLKKPLITVWNHSEENISSNYNVKNICLQKDTNFSKKIHFRNPNQWAPTITVNIKKTMKDWSTFKDTVGFIMG